MAKTMAFYWREEVAIYEDSDKTRPCVAYVAYDMATGLRAEARRTVHNEQSDEAFAGNLELWKQFQANTVKKPSLGRTMSTTGWAGTGAQFYRWAADRGTPLFGVSYMGL